MERVLQATSSTAREPFIQDVRSLAFNTFARCKKVIPHEVRARSMTDFGPAAKEREIVKRTEVRKLDLCSFIVAWFVSSFIYWSNANLTVLFTSQSSLCKPLVLRHKAACASH